MKKILLFLFVSVFTFTGVSAQSDMTQEELQFRNGIEKFLREEGYIPTIDDSDNSVNYKKEGTSYWIIVEGDSPYYIEMHEGGYTMDGENRKVMLEACNHANANKRCGKAAVTDESVIFTLEYFCYSLDEFKKTFYKNMSCINSTKNDVADYYNEHNK